MHLIKIGRLISLYFIIIIVIHKKCKKNNNYLNIAFQNFKIKCAQNKNEPTFQNC